MDTRKGFGMRPALTSGMIVLLLHLMMWRAVAQSSLVPDAAVMSLDDLKVYDVGYAYRGRSGGFPWAGAETLRSARGSLARTSVDSRGDEHFCCSFPGAAVPALPFSCSHSGCPG